MPKNIFVDPNQVRLPSFLSFSPIPMNQYKNDVESVQSLFTTEDLLSIYTDMYTIRAFESLLYEIKKFGIYKGVKYSYQGPLHLSIGQEACAVGQAFLLENDDVIFGSHRSHGEVLAKGFSSIRQLSNRELEHIFSTYDDGAVLRVVSDNSDWQTTARECLIYGLLAEIFAKPNGFQKGFSGSMHAFFPPFGTYPNNAIVGASAPIAVGAALRKKLTKSKNIVVSNVGDGALGRGPVWEALNFAGMDQYRSLWDEPYRGGLPILFNFFNNFYGMGGQTSGETMAFGDLVRIGAGISPSQYYAERVDGSNVLAVIDAMRRKLPILRSGEGPVLLDVITYRISPHSASDHNSYRTQEEVETWIKQDPIAAFRTFVVSNHLLSDQKLNDAAEAVDLQLERIFRLIADEKLTPSYASTSSNIPSQYLYSNESSKLSYHPLPENNSRVAKITEKYRGRITTDGSLLRNEECVTYRDAIFESVFSRMLDYENLEVYGEETRDWGGPYGVYDGLTEAMPYHRFFNAPISESTIVASAVGYAVSGGRALVELPFCDFLGCAGDEIFNQMAKWQYMSGGHLKMPMVLRIAVGSLYGTQHAQDFSSLAAHIPGLKVIYPVTPYDAKGMLTEALCGSDPVIMFESQAVYGEAERFVESGVPVVDFRIPFGSPVLRCEGKDLTIVTVGPVLYTALDAVDALSSYDVSVDLFDLRSIVPLDFSLILDSVRKTGRLLLICSDVLRGSFLNDLATKITSIAFESLKSAPIVLGCENWIAPTPEISSSFDVSVSRILDVIYEKLIPLNCYIPTSSRFDEKTFENSKEGK